MKKNYLLFFIVFSSIQLFGWTYVNNVSYEQPASGQLIIYINSNTGFGEGVAAEVTWNSNYRNTRDHGSSEYGSFLSGTANWKVTFNNGVLPVSGGLSYQVMGIGTDNNFYSQSGFLYTVDDMSMPVELTSFAAKQNGNNVTLNWKTATETNNFGFDVERSADSKNWNKIGFVQGSGNSNAPKDYSYTDKISSLNGKFYYRLKQIDNDGKTSFSKVVEVESLKPAVFGLSQNYPNPFNPSTVIKYQIPVDSRVSVKVYNVLGNVVATLQNGFQTAGEYSVTVDGSNLASGVYFYKIEAGEFSATKKMLLTK